MNGTRFDRFLRENRAELNSAFAAARRHHAGIDADSFAATLITLVGPALEALTADHATTQPDVAAEAGPGTRTGQIGTSLYRAALNLEAHGLFSPIMVQAWRELLPSFESLLADGGEPLIGAAVNAVVKLERSTGGRAEQWLVAMQRISPIAEDATTWLRAGQVAAWRAGMAAYRSQALDLATLLDEAVLTAIFKPAGTTAGDETISRLRADPWFDPGSDAEALTHRAATIASPLRVGGFRGFGGPFRRPPTVRLVDDEVIASDGTGSWQLLADAFGSDLIRVAHPSTSKAAGKPERGVDLGPIVEASSYTPSPFGLVATSRLSHCIFLLGPDGHGR